MKIKRFVMLDIINSETTLISIIIPVYNTEAFLEDAIKSVLEQSHKNLEVILVNDGSTDNSGIICEKYDQHYSNIIYIFQENAGVSVARNKGLLHAAGQYVFFLDSDDTLDKDFLKTSIIAAFNNDVVIIGAHFLKRLPFVHSLPTCAQMWRRDFLNKYPNITFPVGIQPCEDGLFSHQLLTLTNKIGQNSHGIYHYRQHENQNHITINSAPEKVLQQIPAWFNILKIFYTRYNLFESHAQHLALFIEHEPFELRYLGMSLNNEQKKFLFSLIRSFMLENVLPFLKKKDHKLLSKPFWAFMNAKSSFAFDRFYASYLIRRKKQKKLYMFLTKLVFVTSIKQTLREVIRKKFNK